MDARHKYLLEQLANALNLDQSAVEEFMVSDDRVSQIKHIPKSTDEPLAFVRSART